MTTMTKRDLTFRDLHPYEFHRVAAITKDQLAQFNPVRIKFPLNYEPGYAKLHGHLWMHDSEHGDWLINGYHEDVYRWCEQVRVRLSDCDYCDIQVYSAVLDHLQLMLAEYITTDVMPTFDVDFACKSVVHTTDWSCDCDEPV